MKTCKKLGKILLCAGMLTAAAAVPAFAADAQTEPNVTLAVDKTEVAVGEEVTVTISNKEATLAGFGFYLSFDTPKLYCTDVNDAKGKATFVNGFTDDRITLTETAGEAAEGIYSFGVAAAAETTYAAGEVVTLTFRADQVGTANLVLVENSATTAKGVGYKGTVVTQPIDIVEAGEEPSGTLLGDVTLNGVVGPDDVTKLLRHVAGIEEITDPRALINGEVTGDSELGPNDVTKILRYVAGIISSLE